MANFSHVEPPAAHHKSAMLGTLGDFSAEPGCERGIDVDELEPGTHLVVRTTRSCYRFDMLDRERHAQVVGGTMFPEPSEVRIDGSTSGGTVIKTGWVGVGMRLEFSFEGKRVTTSPVQSVSIEDSDDARESRNHF
jgi:hypothetical protein